jgi:hypothetical protein
MRAGGPTRERFKAEGASAGKGVENLRAHKAPFGPGRMSQHVEQCLAHAFGGGACGDAGGRHEVPAAPKSGDDSQEGLAGLPERVMHATGAAMTQAASAPC